MGRLLGPSLPMVEVLLLMHQVELLECRADFDQDSCQQQYQEA